MYILQGVTLKWAQQKRWNICSHLLCVIAYVGILQCSHIDWQTICNSLLSTWVTIEYNIGLNLTGRFTVKPECEAEDAVARGWVNLRIVIFLFCLILVLTTQNSENDLFDPNITLYISLNKYIKLINSFGLGRYVKTRYCRWRRCHAGYNGNPLVCYNFHLHYTWSIHF